MLKRTLLIFARRGGGTTGPLMLALLLVPAMLATPRVQALQSAFRLLYTFHGGGGAKPQAGLIRDAAGNLYGTATQGGAIGYGVVFKLDPSGNETVLYSFPGGDAGSLPFAA